MRDGMSVKAVIPGGSSVPLLPASSSTRARLRIDGQRGTLLGSGGVIVMDDQTCIVDALWNITRFYEHESCGKCTPCREGTYWMSEVFERIESGHGRDADIDLLLDVSDNILGKSFCALGDAAAMPVHRRDQALPRRVRVPRAQQELPGEPPQGGTRAARR
jgi:NADH-quinone oxidoreductase subunit F